MNGRILLKEYINVQEMYAIYLGKGFKVCFDMVWHTLPGTYDVNTG